ncbi:hypothetical protein KCU71_g166, partial [Aureobasidium melanogenum]
MHAQLHPKSNPSSVILRLCFNSWDLRQGRHRCVKRINLFIANIPSCRSRWNSIKISVLPPLTGRQRHRASRRNTIAEAVASIVNEPDRLPGSDTVEDRLAGPELNALEKRRNIVPEKLDERDEAPTIRCVQHLSSPRSSFPRGG